jgi:tripartite-type tricarboxylate transporter receptor subunit TctC
MHFVPLTTAGRIASVSAFSAAAALSLASGLAFAQPKADAQSFPTRPVRIILPNTAGSAMDVVTRMISQRLTEVWGQQVVVDNRAGASGIIGHEIASKAAADGYNLLFSSSSGLIISPLITKVTYDSYRDFAPLSLIVISPQMLVSHPGVPAATIAELVTLARAKPRQLHCASPGTGTTNHLGCEMLNEPTFAKRLSDQGQDPAPTTPEELTTFMRNETERFGKVVKAAGLLVQ